MSAIKRLMMDIYYDSLDNVYSTAELAEKWDVTEKFVEDAITIMSDENEEDQ